MTDQEKIIDSDTGADTLTCQSITVTVANLDTNGVYWGVMTIEGSDLTQDHVQVPPDCDLDPGAYRWDAGGLRFEPLAIVQRQPQGDGITLDEVVYELVNLVSGNLPSRVANWAEQHRKAIGRNGQKV